MIPKWLSWAPWIICGLLSFLSGAVKKTNPYVAERALLGCLAFAGLGCITMFMSADKECKPIVKILSELLGRDGPAPPEAEAEALLRELTIRLLSSNAAEAAVIRVQIDTVLAAVDFCMRRFLTADAVSRRCLTVYRLLLHRMRDKPAHVELPRGALARIALALQRTAAAAGSTRSGSGAGIADTSTSTGSAVADAAAPADTSAGVSVAEDGVVSILALFDVVAEGKGLPEEQSKAKLAAKADVQATGAAKSDKGAVAAASSAAARKKDDDLDAADAATAADADAAGADADDADEAERAHTRLRAFSPGDVQACLEAISVAWDAWLAQGLIGRTHWAACAALACCSAALVEARRAAGLASGTAGGDAPAADAGGAGSGSGSARGKRKGTGVDWSAVPTAPPAAIATAGGIVAEQAHALAVLSARTLRGAADARLAGMKTVSPAAGSAAGGASKAAPAAASGAAGSESTAALTAASTVTTAGSAGGEAANLFGAPSAGLAELCVCLCAMLAQAHPGELIAAAEEAELVAAVRMALQMDAANVRLQQAGMQLLAWLHRG